MVVVGGISLVAALAVGLAAGFYWLDMHYGPYVAYGALASLLFLIGLGGVVAGLLLLKKSLPPIPRPERQARELKRAIAVPATARLITALHGNPVRPDRTTQALAGAAAITLVGWIVTSYLRRPAASEERAQ
jgi:hypothetical protein